MVASEIISFAQSHFELLLLQTLHRNTIRNTIRITIRSTIRNSIRNTIRNTFKYQLEIQLKIISFAQSHFSCCYHRHCKETQFKPCLFETTNLRREFCSVSHNVLFVSFVEGFELDELMFY